MLHYSSHRRRAFTLVEILTVLVIVSIMGGMVLTAVQGVTRTARASRTRAIIATVDNVIQEHYANYRFRSFSVDPPTLAPGAIVGASSDYQIMGYELLSSEAARARMLMIRDLQRMELPDRLLDIADAPTIVQAAATPVLQEIDNGSNSGDSDGDGTPFEVLGLRADTNIRAFYDTQQYDAFSTYDAYINNVDDNGDGALEYDVPPKMASYRDRIPTRRADGSPFDIDRFPIDTEAQNQGAECLYLIMATSYVGGQPAIVGIPSSNIGDTDGDGLLEILDGWGQPLGFIRWPVGVTDSQRLVDATDPDEFDQFRSDFAYVPGVANVARAWDVNFNASDPLHPAQRSAPWSMQPLIVSAGEDGEFGITFNPWADSTDPSTEVDNFSYRAASSVNWPVDANHMAAERFGRTTPYHMIDPYLRNFVNANLSSGNFTGLLPGQNIPTEDAQTARADNITNYQLQAE